MAASRGDGLEGKRESKAHLLCCLASPKIPHGHGKSLALNMKFGTRGERARLLVLGRSLLLPAGHLPQPLAPVPSPAQMVLVK